jgi:hypothetical protein
MTPSPSLSPLASLLLSLAHFIAPKEDKLWIGDMRLEAAFVPNTLQFALSALFLALRFRWNAVRQNRTATLAFASTALAALAVLLFVPRLFNNPPITDGTISGVTNSESYEETSAYLEDVAAQRGISADAQGTTPAADAPTPQTAAPTQDTVAEAPPVVQEPLTDTATTNVAPTQSGDGTGAEVPLTATEEPLAVVPPPAAITPAPSTEATTDAASATLNQEPIATVPTPAEESADATVPIASSSASPTDTTTPENEAVSSSSNGAAPDTLSEASEFDETSARTKLATLPAPITPSADTTVLSTQVKGDSVVLESTDEALLTLYRNSDFAGSPRIHRYLEAGETLTFGIPFSLYTNDASAITVTMDGSSFVLSEDSEEQFRVFTKP